MAPTTQELGSKERSLFAQVVKFYENKQYKKGLKSAEQILRRFPDHGDTIAMKALILNSQGHSEEAFALSKIAIKNSMKSHVCWHVYGLLWRSIKNFDEAIKAYKFALKLAPESTQIQRDLALLQMQMRDYIGYIQSRRAMLQQKTSTRQNWTALAVAQHLSGDLSDAERTLTTYEDIIKSPPPKSDIEHHEAVLYKNSIIAEMGETERALEHLDAATKVNPDRSSVMELRARYLLELGRKQEAEKAFRDLLDRNPENRMYYDGLIASLGIESSNHKELKDVYDAYAKKNPRGDAAWRIPLDFLQGDEFRSAADQYLQRMLRKGIPSTFANLKSLYVEKFKQATIEELVVGYAEGEGVIKANGSAGKTDGHDDTFDSSVQFFLAQHYNYYRSRDLSKALKYIDEAIKYDEKSVDYHMTKARILKHHGDTSKAAEIMEHARSLDERDRYINTKAAKYRLRSNDNEAAIQDMAKFTRNEVSGGPLGDLHDMQCQWFLYEDGRAYLRKDNLGLALKRFNTIFNIFDIWQEDQFDFHSFSLRKGQIRAYVDMIRWEDKLREHPFFARAAIQAASIYLKVYDRPELAHGRLSNGVNTQGMDASERRKAQKKARRDAEKQAQKDAEKKDAKKTAGVDHNGDPKKEDQDPEGLKLLQASEPLVEAMKYINPLLEFSPKNIEAQQIAFEVFVRRNAVTNVPYFREEKYLLALRTINAIHKVDPENPLLHYQIHLLRHTLNNLPHESTSTSAETNTSIAAPLPAKALEVLNTELSTFVQPDINLSESNNKFLQTHHTSPAHIRSALRVRRFLDDPEESCIKALTETLELESSTLEDATEALALVREWDSDGKASSVEQFKATAREKWSQATIFQT